MRRVAVASTVLAIILLAASLYEEFRPIHIVKRRSVTLSPAKRKASFDLKLPPGETYFTLDAEMSVERATRSEPIRENKADVLLEVWGESGLLLGKVSDEFWVRSERGGGVNEDITTEWGRTRTFLWVTVPELDSVRVRVQSDGETPVEFKLSVARSWRNTAVLVLLFAVFSLVATWAIAQEADLTEMVAQSSPARVLLVCGALVLIGGWFFVGRWASINLLHLRGVGPLGIGVLASFLSLVAFLYLGVFWKKSAE